MKQASKAVLPRGEIEFTRIDKKLVLRAMEITAALKRRKLTIVTVESCTGGLLASVLSEAPDASEVLHGGFVVYTKANKEKALQVEPALLEEKGAVCAAVACALAAAGPANSPADAAVAITGVAGPAPDEDGNPVGLVHIACAGRGLPTRHLVKKFGEIGRGEIRYRAVVEALRAVEETARELM